MNPFIKILEAIFNSQAEMIEKTDARLEKSEEISKRQDELLIKLKKANGK